ncbi:MAG: hypothetical protein ACKPKO_42635, partial [Candidatus Fonsibacter sp.]
AGCLLLSLHILPLSMMINRSIAKTPDTNKTAPITLYLALALMIITRIIAKTRESHRIATVARYLPVALSITTQILVPGVAVLGEPRRRARAEPSARPLCSGSSR